MKGKIIRKILGGLSLTSAVFIFQACYGTPQDISLDDSLLEGQVKSKTTGSPIKGIKVSIDDNLQYQITDQAGRFSFYVQKQEKMKIKFQDIDLEQDGSYLAKDTIVNGYRDIIHIDITLDSK